MDAIKEILMDIAASLWLRPGTFDDLRKREFLSGKSEYGINTLVKIAENKGWIYEKGDVYHTYKKTVGNVLNPAGYELDDGSIVESEFRKSIRKQGLI